MLANVPLRYGRTSAKGYWLALLSVVCIGVSSAAALAMHFVLGDRFSVVSQTLSDYVHVESGAFLYGLASLTLAPVMLALIVGITAVGGPRSRTLTWLSAAWAAGLVLVVVFPTDQAAQLDSISAQIHRYAAFVAFLSLPAAGLLLARRLRSDPVWSEGADRIRRWSTVSAVVLAAQVLVRIPTEFPDLPIIGGLQTAGAAERILLGVDLALLLVMTISLLKVAGRPREEAPVIRQREEAPVIRKMVGARGAGAA